MHYHMEAFESLPGVPPATSCEGSPVHEPTPLRFVLHHILPQICGGKTVAANLAGLCDSCHYSVHILLYSIAQGAAPTVGTSEQLGLAEQGYEAAVAAGTVARIPKESDVVIG